MKNLFKSSIFILVGLLYLAACQPKMKFEFASKGPNMEIECPEEAVMGGVLPFKVTLTDDKYPLSTLTAKLMYEELVVDEIEIRTKEEGEYVDTLSAAFLKNIPSGQATVIFTAVNTHLGKTHDTVYVDINHPIFEYLTLRTSSGDFTMMPSGSRYTYSCTGNFPAELPALIITPDTKPVPSMQFGWNGTEIVLGSDTPIPFSNGISGEYTVTFNTLTWEASPFITIEINGSEAKIVGKDLYAAVVKINKGDDILIKGYAPGFEDWTFDTDWFKRAGEQITSNVIDGYYKVFLDLANKYVTAQVCDKDGNPGKFNLDTGLKDAIWLVGTGLGKPAMSGAPGWSPEKSICLAPVEENVFQITAIAGLQLDMNDIDFKFFGQNDGWGPLELKHQYYSANLSDVIFVGDGTNGADSGNIRYAADAQINMGEVYELTLTIGGSQVAIDFKKIGIVIIDSDQLTFGGVEMEQVSASEYQASVDLTKDAIIPVQGIDDPLEWYLDPDYFVLTKSGLKFLASTGKYKVKANIEHKFLTVSRLKADETDATLAEGGLWLMGWGVAHPAMVNQIGWNEGAAYCIAEIAPKKFQFTGIAVGETDPKMGGRFRNDYLSFKYFHQNGWGVEMGTVTLTERTKALLKQSGNLELADDIQLEEGATYVLTIDLSVEGVETVDFYKK